MRRIAAVMAILSLGSCVPGQSAETLPVATNEITVVLWIEPGTFTSSGTADHAPCTPNPPWNTISGGQTVTARDGNGTLVGRGTFEAPYLLATGDPARDECRALARIGVADAATYQLDLAGVQTKTVTRDELAGFEWITVVEITPTP